MKGINVLSRINASGPTQNLFPGGSINFNGSSTSLTVASSTDWNIGTGDFTIQWFHRQTVSSIGAARVFQFGGHPSQLGLSIEDVGKNRYYVWLGGTTPTNFILSGTLLNVWHHFAITRQGNQLRTFQNGVLRTTVTNTANPNLTGIPLTIGRDPAAPSGTFFSGQITNFEYVVGQALYTSAFTPPTTPIMPAVGSRLLLRATTAGTYLTDSSGTNKTVTPSATAPTWSSLNPFAA